MNEQDIPRKLLWMDLEMTGLNPNQRIIEVAVVITDFELNSLATYEVVIHQDRAIMQAAEQWPRENMKELFSKVEESDISEKQVVADIDRLISEHFGDERAVLAGNSIHQDRRFIRKWWPSVEAKLHYRMLDVSTMKVWLQGTTQAVFEKNETHRAMDDVLESIAEFKWSLAELKD